MKKMLRIVLLLTMVFLLLSETGDSVFAADKLTEGEYTYTIKNGEARILRCDSDDEKITTPATLGGVPVTSIATYAFQYCENLTMLIISEGVVSLDKETFSGCLKLEKISFPASVTEIVFEDPNVDCPVLNYIYMNIDNPMYSATNGILYNKDKTKLLWYPSGKTDTSFEIPKRVQTIGTCAFAFCGKLNTIVIPDSVKTIEDYAFYYCSQIREFMLSDNIETIGIGAFEDCRNLKSINLPNKLTEISSHMFTRCSKLETIVIPENVIYIGEKAFAQCSVLRDIVLPEKLESISVEAFNECKMLTEIKIPDNVKKIAAAAFYGCPELEHVTMGRNVETIGSRAFATCYKLKRMVIPDKVTVLYADTFYSCWELEEVVIGNGISSLSASVFDGCHGLTRIFISQSVKNISNDVFWSLASVKDVYYSGSEEQWEKITKSDDVLSNAAIHHNYKDTRQVSAKNIEYLLKEQTSNFNLAFDYVMKPCYAYFCIYRPDEQLLNVYSKKIDAETSEMQMEIPEVFPSGSIVKVLFWEDMRSMNPYGLPIETIIP